MPLLAQPPHVLQTQLPTPIRPSSPPPHPKRSRSRIPNRCCLRGFLTLHGLGFSGGDSRSRFASTRFFRRLFGRIRRLSDNVDCRVPGWASAILPQASSQASDGGAARRCSACARDGYRPDLCFVVA
eukprot:3598238-Pyramimonas_sp.AAC.1